VVIVSEAIAQLETAKQELKQQASVPRDWTETPSAKNETKNMVLSFFAWASSPQGSLQEFLAKGG